MRSMKTKKCIIRLILGLVTLFIWIPLWMLLSGSFMGALEIEDNLSPVLGLKDGLAKWSVLPRFPTLRPYVELLLDSPGFFKMFWNSCIQVFPGLLGQLLAAVPAAWSFARFRFRGKRILFTIYIILMVMPFQVTMVPSYLVLNRLGLMDSHLALILPNIFSTFPVFIMVKFFKSIPESLLEAARLDGAGEFSIFLKIGVPMGASGIISAIILGFLEYWNAIEQPLTFLKSKALWPLSLYLPNITTDKAAVSLAASVIMMTPALLIFLFGQRYLEEGIQASGMKE